MHLVDQIYPYKVAMNIRVAFYTFLVLVFSISDNVSVISWKGKQLEHCLHTCLPYITFKVSVRSYGQTCRWFLCQHIRVFDIYDYHIFQLSGLIFVK